MKLERGKDLLYLSQQQIVDLNITMKQMIDLMEKMYTEKSKGNTQMPSKIALHTVKEFPGDFVHTIIADLALFDGSEDSERFKCAGIGRKIAWSVRVR